MWVWQRDFKVFATKKYFSDAGAIFFDHRRGFKTAIFASGRWTIRHKYVSMPLLCSLFDSLPTFVGLRTRTMSVRRCVISLSLEHHDDRWGQDHDQSLWCQGKPDPQQRRSEFLDLLPIAKITVLKPLRRSKKIAPASENYFFVTKTLNSRCHTHT